MTNNSNNFYPIEQTSTGAAEAAAADLVAKQAMELARTNVTAAMTFIQKTMPTKFLKYHRDILYTLNYINAREQQEQERINRTASNMSSKEYIWPDSFPNCTPTLFQIVNKWIRTEFYRPSRAKCLILIGRTGTGKTTFAKSLPGQYNYFQGRWRLDSWKDSARYLIFDDIPWDKFGQLGFPPRKALLTQSGLTMVTDKYKPSTEINIQQPAIVLLNPDDAGSLINTIAYEQLLTIQQQQIADYWQQRAIIYRIGSDEYFYKAGNHRTRDHPQHTASNNQLSIMNTNQEGKGDRGDVAAAAASIDIFDELTERAQPKHLK